MKKFTAVITDADIRWYIDQAATELEEDNQIRFPDSEARKEFIEDCVSSEIDSYELYETGRRQPDPLPGQRGPERIHRRLCRQRDRQLRTLRT